MPKQRNSAFAAFFRIFFSIFIIFFSIFKANAAEPRLITTTPAIAGSISRSLEYIGTLSYSEKSALATESSGVIDEIFVNEGERVKKNQPLARLNSDILEDEITAKEAQLSIAKVALQRAQKNFARYESLLKTQSIAYKEYEDSMFELQGQKANAKSITAELSRLKTELGKKTIKAPYECIILQKNLRRGEWVGAGASVFSIARQNPLEANIWVPFSALKEIKAGQKVSVSAANKEYSAKISAIIPLGDTRARTFPVKLAVEDPNSELLEGVEIRVRLQGTQTNSLLVPREAIMPSFNGNYVFVVENDKAVRVNIKILGYEGTLAAVEATDLEADSPLKPNAKIISSGNERIKNGEKVKIK